MTIPTMTTGGWLAVLAVCTVKVSLILAAAWLATKMLRRGSASSRHAIWAAAAVAALLLPVASFLLPAWHTGILEKAVSFPVAWSKESAREPASLLTAMVIGAETGTTPQNEWMGILLLVWAAGLAVTGLTLLTGAGRLAWLVWRAEPLLHPMWTRLSAEVSRALGLRRPVRLLRSHRATMPVTWGVLQPRVLLPKEAENWPVERVRVVLSHELAHVQRRDWLFQMLAEAGRVLYWFNPLAWVNCDRLRRESEQACDDAVLNSGIDAPDYAEHLLELARTLKSSDRAWSVALAMARQTNLERRFMAMFDPSVKRRAVTRKATFLTVFAAVCLTLTLASLRAPAQMLSGRFSGAVYDDTGGVIQNATVIVSNPEAKTKDMTTTSQFGSFEFVSLPSGQYVLEILKPGFARFVLTGLGLQPGESLHKNVTLRLGTVSERIDVVAASPAKQTPVAQAGEGERVRVGGRIQQTKLAKMVRPAYPPVAKSTGIEGAVLLEAIIGTDGSLMSLRVMNSQIDPDLAKAAVEAVSQWRYEPTLLNGVPVEVITNITVNFQLSQ